jgi:hypothetical protein
LVGDWTAQVELDGQAQLQLDEWRELCWFSDNDVDYIELEAKFGPSAKIQRQAVLFRESSLLLLADSLLGDSPGAWSMRSHIPLASGTDYQPARRTTEGTIRLPNKSGCLVLPLALPEWRRQPSSGSLTSDDDSLIANADAGGQRRIYMPVLISLKAKAAKQKFTWRHLTVGEELRIVSRDEAVAYRVQIGEEQWLLYRTLAAATRRTALGMHTMADFFAGHWDASEGEPDTLVEVEPG